MKNPLGKQGAAAEIPTHSLLTPSSRRLACPICSRSKDGDCRISDQLVLCHYGSSHHPPQHLKPGDVIPGADGQQWAYTGDTSGGRAATFTLHKPRQSHRPQPAPQRQKVLQLAQLPAPAKAPPERMPNGQRINYSETQWVIVECNGDNKRHIPHHQGADGQQHRCAGDQPWPLWRQAEASEHGRGKWIAEAEGEKCAAWFRAAGVVAISQPGHDHKPASIERRYRQLLQSGVAGVLYLADNDPTGEHKAEKCAAAAAAVGLPLLVVHAVDVWPGLPAGGSIDDAPGSAAERLGACRA